MLGGIALWAAQLIGSAYVTRVVLGASDVYGTFAIVFGLLVWIALLARIVLVANEVNVVRSRHLWPRSFLQRVDPEAPDPEVKDPSAQIGAGTEGPPGSTRIFTCSSGLPSASNAAGTPSTPHVPVIIGDTSISPSAIARNVSPNSNGS